METESRPTRLALALLIIQLLAATATALFPVHQKGVVFLGLATLGSITILATSSRGFKPKLVATFLATCLALLLCYLWRRFFPLAVFGPFSGQLEAMVFAVTGSVIMLAAGIVSWCSTCSGILHRGRWAVSTCVTLATIVLCWTACPKPPSTSHLIQRITVLERDSLPGDFHSHQELGFLWSAFGRMHETRRLVTQPKVSQVPRLAGDMQLTPVPWRDAVTEIAQNHRIVFIMESHLDTSHREWIQQTLPIFTDAGFTHYAAEALSESGETLARRGYPIRASGHYTMDPRFGNLLRTAIEQGLTIVQYDTLANTHRQREEASATRLAAIIASNPNAKLIVHAGFAHVWKRPTQDGQRWLANLLWEKTGIEPYSIYQTVEDPSAYNYQQMVRQIGDIEEPVMLSPLPTLNDFQLGNVTNEIVDALLVHPRETRTAADDRKPVFASGLQRIAGDCNVDIRPIVIGAYKQGESTDAIALDQILLRHRESSFDLWVPQEAIELRVDGPSGPHQTRTTKIKDRVRIDEL